MFHNYKFIKETKPALQRGQRGEMGLPPTQSLAFSQGRAQRRGWGPHPPLKSRAFSSGAMAGLIHLTTGLSLLQSAASSWHNLEPQGGHSVLPYSGQSGQAVGSRGNSPTGPSRFIPGST